MFSEELRSPLQNHVAFTVRDKNGRIKEIVETTNIITNAGIDWLADALGNASGSPANYVAVSTDTATPLATDTTLTSELTVDGLSRASGTYSHTTAVRSYSIEKIFSVTGGPHAVAKSALFNAAGPPPSGTMAFEALFATIANVNASDSLTVTWTVNF